MRQACSHLCSVPDNRRPGVAQFVPTGPFVIVDQEEVVLLHTGTQYETHTDTHTQTHTHVKNNRSQGMAGKWPYTGQCMFKNNRVDSENVR